MTTDDQNKNSFRSHIFAKFTSGRWISTVLIVSTYCFILTLGTICCLILAHKSEFAAAEKLFVYIIGNMTGTAVGAIVAYHFKKKEEQNEIV